MLYNAFSLFNSFPHSTKNLNSLLSAAILTNDHDSVAKFFRDFSTVDPDLETYNLVIKSFSESGSTCSAYSLLDEMQKRGLRPSTTIFNYMISGFYREEKLNEVDKIIELMKEKYGLPPGLSTYNERILSLCKLKRTKEAKVLLDEMSAKGMKMNWVSYSNLIVGFCKEEELEEAKRLYGEMKRKRFFPSSKCQFSLIQYLTKGEDYEAAVEVCKEIVGRNLMPGFNTIKKLVMGLAKRGKGEEAKELVGKMKEKFPGKEEKWMAVEAALSQ